MPALQVKLKSLTALVPARSCTDVCARVFRKPFIVCAPDGQNVKNESAYQAERVFPQVAESSNFSKENAHQQSAITACDHRGLKFSLGKNHRNAHIVKNTKIVQKACDHRCDHRVVIFE